MNYQQRLAEVISFIGTNLDEEVNLDTLSETFGISKFHLHRLFTAFTGLSLQQYIRWLRLKRAARQLVFEKDKTILEIAINAGFSSHEAFSRVFKKICGYSPNQYRKGLGWSSWEQPPYCMPTKGNGDMKVTVKNINAIRLAVVEHRGDPQLIPQTITKLISWAEMQTTSIKPRPGESFAIAYDDPQTTAAKDFRIDFGIKIPENFKLNGVKEKYLPAGRYAIATHKGSRDNIGETVYHLYRDWLPNSKEELGDLPCIFCYYNFEHEVAETELVTECWLLLK